MRPNETVAPKICLEQVKAQVVVFFIVPHSASKHDKDRLDIGAYLRLRIAFVASLAPETCWCVLAYIGRENLHNWPMVPFGVSRDPLKGVASANTKLPLWSPVVP